MPVIKIHTEEDFNYVLSTSSKIVIDFGAVSWCGPCRMMEPKFHALSNEPQYKDITFLNVDVDENPNLAKSFVESGIPLFVSMIDGVAVHKVTGANEGKLRGMIDTLANTPTQSKVGNMNNKSIATNDANAANAARDLSELEQPRSIDDEDYEYETS